MNELSKEQYRILYQKIKNIQNKLNNLEDIYEELFLNIKDGITINDKVFLHESLDNIKKNINNIKQETIYEIIPNINNKI